MNAGIGIFIGMVLVVTAANSEGGTYTTSFLVTENPISESGHWLNGKTDGLDWADVRTTPGLASGTESGSGGYDDSTAVLKGTWGPNQSVRATVHFGTRAGGGTFKEVEIRLRSSISAHSNTGYEINFSLDAGGGAYTQIVRWNGPLGNFTYIDSRGGSQYQINEGDEVKAVISGNTITSYIRGQQVLQVTDNTFTSGSPGMGFYLEGTGTNDFGFNSFSATDGSSTNQPPVAVAKASATNGVVPFSVSFSSAGSIDPEGAALTYSWTFGDGGTSTAANPAHTYTSSGIFSARLSVSDGTNTTTAPPLALTVRPSSPTNLHIVTGP